MRDKLIEITFAIEHENCWTSYVGNYMVRTVNFSVDSEKNYIRSIIIFDRTYKNLISRIKKSNSFLGYSTLKLDQNGRILFDFRKKFKNSVLDALYTHNGIVINGFKYNGKEFWRALVYESYINELVEDLKSKGTVHLIKNAEFNVEEEDLTPQELKIILTAYKTGYFDFPRRIKSDNVSKLVDISKSTFTYHLRSAEHKIIKRYLKEIEFYNLLKKLEENEGA
ncbi:helix-turn-helix domain-containing protein [Sulfolobus tengchongensis]|uniref:Helix-turn-helix domain-containing protein n=1 Tax=Sulfolobus tengchongensis TaxID=207809 RepID=A0AAX4L1K1_9CREN